MSGIVISDALALTLAAEGRADYPVIGWQNLVTVDNVAADDEEATYPATNLANPSTTSLQGWRSDEDTDDQYITIDPISSDTEIDYVGVARHNWGSTGCTISVEAITAEPGAAYEEVFDPFIPADDGPLIMRFVPGFFVGVRIKIEPNGTAPRAAVVYVGKLLEFEYGVQAGHTPIPYGRSRRVVTGRSQGGDYLGRIVVGGKLTSNVSIKNLDPDRYREDIEPFARDGALLPFFWAWKPETYPNEVGFAWLPEGSEIIPVPNHLAGYIDISFPMEGII